MKFLDGFALICIIGLIIGILFFIVGYILEKLTKFRDWFINFFNKY